MRPESCTEDNTVQECRSLLLDTSEQRSRGVWLPMKLTLNHFFAKRHTDLQQWAERGGLVEQHEAMADEAVKWHDAEQQRLADLRFADGLQRDAEDRAWRELHPVEPTEDVLKRMREYMKQAVEQREKIWKNS